MNLPTDQNLYYGGLSGTGKRFVALCDSIIARRERVLRSRVAWAIELGSLVLTNILPAFFDDMVEALS